MKSREEREQTQVPILSKHHHHKIEQRAVLILEKTTGFRGIRTIN